MQRVLGVFLLVLGLAMLQFSGVLAFSRGGIDIPDLFTFRWISNMMDWRLRGGGGMYIGLGIVAIIFIIEGLRRVIRGPKKQKKQKE